MIQILGLALFSGTLGTLYAVRRIHQARHLRRQERLQRLVGTTAPAPQGSPSAAPLPTPPQEMSEESATTGTSLRFEDSRLLPSLPQVDRAFQGSLTALGMASAGYFFYAPLAVASVVPLAFANQILFREGISSLQNGEIKIIHFKMVGILMGVASGIYALGALVSTVYLSSLRTVHRRRQGTRQSLSDLCAARAGTVWQLRADGLEVETPLLALQSGDRILLGPGDRIPMHGRVEEGWVTVMDPADAATHVRPRAMETGDLLQPSLRILSGTLVMVLNESGTTAIARNTEQALERTDAFLHAPAGLTESRVDGSIPPALVAGGIIGLIRGPWAMGSALSANYADILRLGLPLLLLNHVQRAAEEQVLVQDGQALAQWSRVDTVVFAKTGVLVQDTWSLQRILALPTVREQDVLLMAAIVGYQPTHPLAQAVGTALAERGLFPELVVGAEYHPGGGCTALLGGRQLHVGSAGWIQTQTPIAAAELESLYDFPPGELQSLLYVVFDGQLCGGIVFEMAVRPEARLAIQRLRQRGIITVLLSGDGLPTVQTLAHQVGVDAYDHALSAEQRADFVRRLQGRGRTVCCVGAGWGDRDMLAQADLTVALHEGEDAAVARAQIVLLNKDLNALADIVDRAREFQIQQLANIGAVVAPSVISVLGVLVLGFGITQVAALYMGSLVASMKLANTPLSAVLPATTTSGVTIEGEATVRATSEKPKRKPRPAAASRQDPDPVAIVV